jgi:hypothetical protein
VGELACCLYPCYERGVLVEAVGKGKRGTRLPDPLTIGMKKVPSEAFIEVFLPSHKD